MKRHRLARYGLSSDERLHGETAFKSVFKARRRERYGPFVLHYWVREEARSRLGIVASRVYGGAVERNCAKRLIREQFRRQKHGLVSGDYIIRICEPLANYSRSDLKRVLTALFEARKPRPTPSVAR